jgi:hypothetical protein
MLRQIDFANRGTWLQAILNIITLELARNGTRQSGIFFPCYP